MNIRVLGCSGAIAAGSKTTAFLLDHDVLIDAGSGVGDLTLDELLGIDHILLSHSHLDHILSVALLADSVIRQRTPQRRGPIVVHALPATLDALRTHVFNGVIWPDFSRLPSADEPVLRFEPFEVGQVLDLGGRHVEVLSAAHTVPAVGFAVHGRDGAWVFTGDTGPNPELWRRLAAMRLSHLVIETAFSDDETALARLTRHLCPSMLGTELRKLGGSVQVHITHIKPGETDAVMAEVGALETPHRLRALMTGEVIAFE